MITNMTEVKRFAKGSKGRTLFRHYYRCENCNTEVNRLDRFCRECGAKFVMPIHLEEEG